MKFKVTIKSALLGLVVSIVSVFQSFGKVSGGKWSETVGVVVSLIGAALGLAIAVTAISPANANPASPDKSDTLIPVADKPRPFRSMILQWLGLVVAFLLVFYLLDAFHVDWRRYLH
jgi:amino acid transporter